MTIVTIFVIFTLLFTKHLVADFFIQTPYMYLNKGKYGHPGGLLHSGIQALGTFMSLWWFAPIEFCLYVTLFDFIIHYHTDYAKVKINNRFGWKPDNSENYWRLLGLDQFVHCMTYVAIVWMYCIYMGLL
jgi:hypothetical protein